MKLIECVPNFSEGQNPEIIAAIAEAIRKIPGCTLLDVDPGKSTNRTVYTFVGSPAGVVEGALSAARVARKLIDMKKHRGEHPRMGALDVCPFIPISEVTMEDCVKCAHEFGRQAAEELRIPVYLYEAAAKEAHRKSLAQIREGEYEALSEKIKRPEWRPDYGPAEFVPEWGATVTGARVFLIAYNINVLGTKQQAHRMALNLREGGRGDGYSGRLKEVKAIGWTLEEHHVSQISINLTDYKVTPPHVVFEAAREEAQKLSVGIAGSELVGLIPLEALLMAAEYYIRKENLFILDEDQKIRLAVDRLGLNSISRFEPKKRIIEYLLEAPAQEPLATMSTRGFVEFLGARTAAPGGGSAAALIASMGAALASMVGQLTYGIKKFESVDSEMRKNIPPVYTAMKKLISMIDADTDAFNDYVEATRLPEKTEEQKRTRQLAMQTGLKKAVQAPLSTMRIGDSCWGAMIELGRFININSRSDLEVGARALECGIWGAYRNVLINLAQIEDEGFRHTITQEAEKLVKTAAEKCQRVLETLAQRT